MKKFLAIVLAIVMTFSLVACSGGNGSSAGGASKKIRLETWLDYSAGTVVAAEFSYPAKGSVKPNVEIDNSIWLEGKDHTFIINLFDDGDYISTRDWAVGDVEAGEGKATDFHGLEAYYCAELGAYTMIVLLEAEPSANGNRYMTINIETGLETEEEIIQYVESNEEIQSILKSFVYLGETATAHKD